MNIYVEEVPEDITQKIKQWENPLIIYSQDSQWNLLSNKFGEHLMPWWSLKKEKYFIGPNATSKWLDHDIIIFLDPKRSGNRLVYYRLIAIVGALNEHNTIPFTSIL